MQDLGRSLVAEGNVFDLDQGCHSLGPRGYAGQNLQGAWRRVGPGAKQNILRRQLDFTIVYFPGEPIQRTQIVDVAISYEHHPGWSDPQYVLDAMLNHQDGHALIDKPPNHVKGVLSTGWIQARERLIQQEDTRAHRQHARERHLLLF